MYFFLDAIKLIAKLEAICWWLVKGQRSCVRVCLVKTFRFTVGCVIVAALSVSFYHPFPHLFTTPGLASY